ncbi:30S ribosomal protein S20 [Desulfovibrio litoralis]|uniref:Small ribosomal subunit protein bS20 n=1 Tax=Desulfovibrio litoralis DSM 11393 TaxID=1121455 RepID=A0A1M7SX15_9BACT|nr:30S ribosomal protein S20 [Desulfovibrio litoralis]SHN63012.1 SSU ribosomal protein S20P [Desulfovibrio litoralis DSM 11393]
MANHKSAIKRHKQSLKKASKNRAVKTRVKNVVKDVRQAIQGMNKEEALVALNTARSVLDKAGSKKILHWKNVARKVSRLNKAVMALND